MMEHRIVDILARLTGSDVVRLDPHVRLFDLGLLDSLQTVELLIELSDELGVEIAPSEIDRNAWATPAGIVAGAGFDADYLRTNSAPYFRKDLEILIDIADSRGVPTPEPLVELVRRAFVTPGSVESR